MRHGAAFRGSRVPGCPLKRLEDTGKAANQVADDSFLIPDNHIGRARSSPAAPRRLLVTGTREPRDPEKAAARRLTRTLRDATAGKRDDRHVA